MVKKKEEKVSMREQKSRERIKASKKKKTEGSRAFREKVMKRRCAKKGMTDVHYEEKFVCCTPYKKALKEIFKEKPKINLCGESGWIFFPGELTKLLEKIDKQWSGECEQNKWLFFISESYGASLLKRKGTREKEDEAKKAKKESSAPAAVAQTHPQLYTNNDEARPVAAALTTPATTDTGTFAVS